MSFLRNMFTNWKTTASGLATIAYVVMPMFGVVLPPGSLEVVLGAVGVGLVAAKDSNMTGGTKPQ